MLCVSLTGVFSFSDCGVADLEVAPLIVNGWITEQGKFPWHAVLFTLEEGNWTFTCGGSLITERIVLTGKCNAVCNC